MASEFVLPEFLEDCDADTIHARMMDELPDDIDKTEGGFPWDFTRPTALIAAELLQFYIPEAIKLMFPQWSSGEFLDYLAAGSQVKRKDATYAEAELQIEGEPGTIVASGSIFATESKNNHPSIEFASVENCILGDDGKTTVTVRALLSGKESNVNAGTIVLMSEPIDGIRTVTNQEKASGGTDQESDGELRERILKSNAELDISYAGNNADYKRWAEEVSGMGTAIIIPEWNGPGTVKIVCVDANGDAASQTILDAVYNHIIAPNNPLERLAPIGAMLTVSSPDVIDVDYKFTAILKDGCSQETLLNKFKTGIAVEYRKAKEDGKLKYSQVFAMTAKLDEVYDLLDLTMNENRTNINLDEGQYLRTKDIDITIEKGV